jgi:uncharacterized protein (DUF302 family)
MSYHFSKVVDLPHDKAIERTTEILANNKLGVLTTIDVKAAMKTKIDKDMRAYTILGACSPSHAFKAIEAERHIGTMLPCNVIVQDTDDGKSEISAINPIASMQAVGNETLGGIASEVEAMMKKVIEEI